MPTFDEWLQQQDNSGQTATNLSMAVDANPQAAADAVKQARRNAIPPSLVGTQPDPDYTRRNKLEDAASAVQQAPSLEQWLNSQPQVVAAAVHDDLHNLSALDKALEVAKGSGKALYSSLYGFNEGFYGLVEAGGSVLPDAMGDGIEQFGRNARLQAQDYKNSLMPQATDPLSAGWYSGLQSTGQMALTLPLALLSGNPVTATAIMGGTAAATTGGQSFGQARDAGLDVAPSLTFATGQGLIEYLTEQLPALKLFGDLNKGSGLGRIIRNQLATEIPGEQLATVLQDFNEWATLNPEKPFSEFVAERPEAALTTAIATLVGGGAMSATALGLDSIVRRVRGEDARVTQARQLGETLRQLQELADATSTRERDVETLESFLQTATDNTPVEALYIDGRTLMESGLADQLAAASPAVASQIAQAQAGTMVRIPTAEVLGRFNQELAPLLPEMRTDPNGFTQREAEEFVRDRGPELQAEVERVLGASDQNATDQESRQRVRDTVASELMATGRVTREVADAYATLTGAFYHAMGKRMGKDAETLFNEERLRVINDGTGEFDQAGFNRRLQLRELHKQNSVQFVDATIDRGGAHTPSGPNSGSPAYDVALNGTYPEDFYSYNGLRYYGTGNDKMDAEAHSTLMRLAGRPNHQVTIYRAVEKDGPSKIQPGDWVTTVRAYAKEHGEAVLKGDYKIVKMLVHARDIYTSGDSMLEWGYHPQERMPEVPRQQFNQPFDGPEAAKTALAEGATEIDVDGVMRPALNSEGKPIHWSEEGTRNFWRWFGDSKAVDAKGRPLVVYHGTHARNIQQFKPGRAGAIYFTENKQYASDYGPSMIGAYLRVNNVADMTDPESPAYKLAVETFNAEGGWAASEDAWEQMQEDGQTNPLFDPKRDHTWEIFDLPETDIQGAMLAAGYDAFKLQEYGGVDSFAVMSSKQVKSATGNSGSFGDDPNIFRQSVSLRRGTQTLRKYGLDPSKKYKTREVAAALEARQREKFGAIAPDDRSPEAARKIAGWMTEEVMFAMENPEQSGVGWYSVKFQRAIDTFAKEFPELATDKTARDIFTILVAVTSDGQKVLPNFAQAADIYGNFRTSGKFTTSRGHARQASIDNNLQRIQQMHDEMGAQEMRDFLMQERTVRELKAVAKAQGKELKTAYQVDVVLPMAAVVLGPKLGAFYANLMGAHGYLTMDRWWSRTFNRYRGVLLQQPTRQGLDRFKELYAADKRLNRPPSEISDDEVLSFVVEYRNSYEAKGYKNGTEIEKAANTIYKMAFENLEDTPFNASDRTFMLDAVAKAASNLKRRGVDMSIADIQAVLWYYEKRLYGELGARQTADISYEEAASRVVEARASGTDLTEGPAVSGSDGNTAAGMDEGVPAGEEDYQSDEGDGEFYQSGNEPRLATWFSGGRTLEAAIANVTSVMAVEHDAKISRFANASWGTEFSTRGVEEVDPQELIDANVTLFHASPVCKNFSAAKTLRGATDLDLKSAESIARAIREAKPPMVTIENVPEYQNTALFKLITDALDEAGYKWEVIVHNAADYGAAQNRERMLLRAVRNGQLPPQPAKSKPMDWMAAVGDLLNDAPKGEIPAEERRRLDEMIAQGKLDPSRPIITMGGSGFKGTWSAANDGGPAPTLKSAHEKPRIIMPDGTVHIVTPRMMARLMGLPDSFQVPDSGRFAKTVLGNGIHGNVTRAFIVPMLEQYAADNPVFNQSADPFYSALQRGLESVTASTPEQWKSAIRSMVNKGQVKQDEVEWSGIDEWLDLQKEVVSKQKVLDYLKAGGVRVQDVVRSEEASRQTANEYAQNFVVQTQNEFRIFAANNGFTTIEVDGEMMPMEDVLKLLSSFEIDPEDLPEELSDVAYNVMNVQTAYEEGMLGSDVPSEYDYDDGRTKYNEYTLPASENYREILLTLPTEGPAFQPKKVTIQRNRSSATQGTFQILYDNAPLGPAYGDTGGSGQYGFNTDNEIMTVAKRLFETGDKINGVKSKVDGYTGSHWSEKNVLAHIRVNTRMTQDGKRTLFVEEVQSDWAQEGRDKGFARPGDKQKLKNARVRWYELNAQRRAAEKEMSELLESGLKNKNLIEQNQKIADLQSVVEQVNQDLNKLSVEITDLTPSEQSAPAGPFVESTQKWLTLALKRIVVMASQEGFDSVAFINGEQSSERYSLSERVDEIQFNKNPNGTFDFQVRVKNSDTDQFDRGGASLADVEEMFGKDIAEQMNKVDAADKANATSQQEWLPHSLSGDNLRVGNKGMFGFYDNILPATLKKLLPKVGGKDIKTLSVDTGYPGDNDFTDQLGFDVTPAMRQATIGGLPMFQGQDGEVRGSFSPSQLAIRLTKAQNLSTFLHESGHFYLHMMTSLATRPDAPADIIADAHTALTWMGVEAEPNQSLMDTWLSMTVDQQREYHERFARGFEVYLYEGKAPSAELEGVFSRFRAWLVNVYKQLMDAVRAVNRTASFGQAHRAPLSDEVRAVFDRMLATEDEIKAAQAARSMGMMFASAEEAAKFGIDWQAYQEQGQAATDAAVSDLDAQRIRNMKWLANARSRLLKKLQKDYKDIRLTVHNESRAEAMAIPAYQAWEFLTTPLKASDRDRWQKIAKSANVQPDTDSLLTAIAKLGGLQVDEVESQWGFDPADMRSASDRTGLGNGKPVARRKDGKSIEAMAELLADLGYIAVDENGKHDLTDFHDKLENGLMGRDHYSNAADWTLKMYGPQDETLTLDFETGVTGAWGGRLDYDALIQVMGSESEFKRLMDLGMVRKAGGDHPDAVAEAFGFSSGQELVRDLMSSRSPHDYIEGLTDAKMMERYSELATPQAREDAVSRALATQAAAKVQATELAALEKAMNVKGKGKTGRTQNTLPSAAKSFAEQVIARLVIREIRPSQFTGSASRAGRAATKAAAAGNLQEAALEKRNQLVNTYAARAASEAIDEVERGVSYLKKFDNDGTRKNLDLDYLEQIDAILERYELKRVSNKGLDKRKALSEWIAEQEAMGITPDLPPHVSDAAKRANYRELSVEEFRGLVESIKQIEHFARLKKKLLLAKDKREFQALMMDLKASIAQHAGSRTANNTSRGDVGSLVMRGLKMFTAAHRKVASLAYQADGFQDGGPLWDTLVRTANEQSNWEATQQAEMTGRLASLLKALPRAERPFSKGRYFAGVRMSLTQEMRLTVALNWGNEGNRQRLMSGRNWSMNAVQEVLDSLTQEEWQFVQGVWDAFESLRPAIAEKERRVMGKEPNWVQPIPVTTPFGQLRGGYFPIVYDPRENLKAEENDSAEAAKRQLQGARSAATTRRNFVKARAAEVTGRPVLLTMDGMFRGLTDVIHDLAFHEWLIDANRVMRAIDQDLRDTYGAEFVQQFRSSIEAIAAGEATKPYPLDPFIRHVRVGSMVAGLGLNIVNAALQPLGITQSIVRIGAKWVAMGAAKYAANPAAAAREVLGKSEFMRNRKRTQNRELNDLRNRIRGRSEARQKFDALLFLPMTAVQMTVDYPTWLGAYEKAQAEGHDDDTAVQIADQAVIASQGGGQIKDLAAIQRGPEMAKVFTVFYGYFNTAYNLGAERFQATNFRSPAQVFNLAADYLLLYAVPAVLGLLIKEAFSGGDDEDELADKLKREQISYLFSLMVGVREFTGAAQMLAGTDVKGGTSYGGPAGLRFMQEVFKFSQQVNQGDADLALLRSGVNVAGIATHLPSAQINRTIDGVVAISEGRTQNPVDSARALVAGAPR